MANLKEIAELAWRQLGGGTDESRFTLEEFVATAKVEYAWQYLQWLWAIYKQEGYYEIPGYLITESEPLPVKNNEIDISGLKIMRSIPDDRWLVNIGGLACGCEYIRVSAQKASLLCDDDSLDDDVKPYVIKGKKIEFLQGAHSKELTIMYVNNGEDAFDEDVIEVEDGMAGIVRNRLVEIYAGRTNPEDKTNNSSSNQ